MRYGILVWGNAPQTSLEPLEVLANKAIRIMANLPYSGALELGPVYQELKLLELHKINKLETGKFIFKEKNGLLPTRIGNGFEIGSSVVPHGHWVRHERTPRFISNLHLAENSIQFTSMDLWDTMPEEIKSAESFKVFKRAYKKYLIG